MATRLKSMLGGAKSLGPYLLIELTLPGGTLIALALWLFRRFRQRPAADAGGSAQSADADAEAMPYPAQCACR